MNNKLLIRSIIIAFFSTLGMLFFILQNGTESLTTSSTIVMILSVIGSGFVGDVIFGFADELISCRNFEPVQYVKCIQTLYKSTYKKNAFIKNRKYRISKKYKDGNLNFYNIIDECGNEFDFCKTENSPYHFFDNYFKKR